MTKIVIARKRKYGFHHFVSVSVPQAQVNDVEGVLNLLKEQNPDKSFSAFFVEALLEKYGSLIGAGKGFNGCELSKLQGEKAF
ncbi:MAG: hypothetical protein HXX08_05375 [Chloroflexi bacterium]|uniref:Uncharacterized protein n=1 Tax=Candidatus Chlorohelix allophototropha TaxID=3003348 RepID=A0A8T7LYB6_9CHLR|nr:hypothetical protein [Chloroflexota bacterium]WJW67167.1 hypothetical protein OZ401_000423 [Chloroflexota bacterium L227-S17]